MCVRACKFSISARQVMLHPPPINGRSRHRVYHKLRCETEPTVDNRGFS